MRRHCLGNAVASVAINSQIEAMATEDLAFKAMKLACKFKGTSYYKQPICLTAHPGE